MAARDLLAGIVFAFMFAWSFAGAPDPDFWWHAKVGQYVVEHRHVPLIDTWTYTIAGQPWMAHEWLAEVVMYAALSLAGYGAVTALTSLSLVIAYFTLHVLLRRLGASPTWALLFTIWAFFTPVIYRQPRPQLLTYPLVAIFVYVLFLRNRSSFWLLPLLTVIWVNLHASYVVGLLLLGCFLFGETWNRLRGRPAPLLRSLFVTSLASGLAVLANPYGIEVIAYPLSKAAGNASMAIITEWRSPSFHEWFTWPFLAALIATIVLPRGRPVDVHYRVAAAVLAVLGLYSGRHMVLYAFVAMPVFAVRFAPKPAQQRSQGSLAITIGALLLPVTVAALLLTSVPPMRAGLDLGPSPALRYPYPVGGVAYLKANLPAGRLLNNYDWGGYLVNRLPEYPVFIDGRGDPFPNAVVDDYARMIAGRSGWRETLDRYDVGVVLIARDVPLGALLQTQPDWLLAYAGPIEQVFVHRQH